jgi:hypothetical protein
MVGSRSSDQPDERNLMLKRWTHLHSGATGGLVLALATGHLAWLLAVTFAAGILVGVLGRQLRSAGKKVGGYTTAQARLTEERWKEVRARRAASVDKRRASRAEVEKAYKRGVIEGRLDGTRAG